MASYVFENTILSLKHHGENVGELTEVNSRDCMKYLTELADPAHMLTDSLLTDQKELWWKMADADEVVDLFNKSTWIEDDYEPLVSLIHQKVVPHELHQQ